MHGWRARIGLIIADSNTTMEPEFNKVAPEGVSIHCARVRVGGVSVEGTSGTDPRMEEAASLLSNINARAIAYACTAANIADGPEAEAVQARKMMRITGVPAVTAAAALVEALEALNIRRIALATPYPPDLNGSSAAFWEQAGFQVTAIEGANLGGARAKLAPLAGTPVSLVGLQFPATAYNVARMVAGKADAILVSGANLRSLEMIEAAEQDFGVPVISSASAVIWATLQAAGVRAPIRGYGRLLAEQPPLGWRRIPRPE